MLEIIYTLVMTHITIVCVTLYLHRGQAHRGIEFNPVLEHIMRFWLWLTTGMKTKEWVAIHRCHHRFTEKEGDPHSPHVFGIWKVLFKGALLYNEASKNKEMINSYGVGTPNDWIEKSLYTPYHILGIILLLCINVFCFSYWGILIWLIQMIWIPFWAAGVINGLGHWFGYRNFDTKDKSTNINPIGILIGGEELHNNHHDDPANPKLSKKSFEFDVGWMWLNIFRILGLVKIRGVAQPG